MENDPSLTPPPKIWNFPYVLSLLFFESFPNSLEVKVDIEVYFICKLIKLINLVRKISLKDCK